MTLLNIVELAVEEQKTAVTDMRYISPANRLSNVWMSCDKSVFRRVHKFLFSESRLRECVCFRFDHI